MIFKMTGCFSGVYVTFRYWFRNNWNLGVCFCYRPEYFDWCIKQIC